MISWESVEVTTDLPEVRDEISYQRVVMNSGSTWDYTPVHFDPYYAEKQGHPGIFVNTMHIAGFADRIATDWAGPQSRVVRRKMRLAGSIYAGDSMVGRGRVVANVNPMLNWINRMGEPLYGHETPDGYPLKQEAWASAADNVFPDQRREILARFRDEFGERDEVFAHCSATGLMMLRGSTAVLMAP